MTDIEFTKQAGLVFGQYYARTIVGLATIDKITKTNKQNLRTLLMDIDTKDKKSKLYLGINEDTRGDGVFFTFPTALETEVRDMIIHFGTLLAHETFPDVLLYLKTNRPNAPKKLHGIQRNKKLLLKKIRSSTALCKKPTILHGYKIQTGIKKYNF